MFKDVSYGKWWTKQNLIAYTNTNPEYYRNYKRKRQLMAKEWLLKQKIGKCCLDCGENDSHRLDFHHIDPSSKIDSVSHMINKTFGPRTIERALEEIKKCVLLCKRCHFKRNKGRPRELGVRDQARRYPLARCIYLARWARRGIRLN